MTKTKSLDTKISTMFSKMKGIHAEKSKEFVLPLYFVKRMSDSFEEEAERIFQETGDEDKAWNKPEMHKFYVPEPARWKNLRKANQDPRFALGKAFDSLGEYNERLMEVLTYYASEAKNQEDFLEFKYGFFKIIDSLSDISLRDADLEDSEDAVRIFQRMIRKLAQDEMKTARCASVPKQLASLMVALLEPEDEMSVYDPVCGTGDLLVESNIYLKAKGENESLKLYGQAPHKTGWRLCNLALPINEKFDSVIETGDALTMPAFVENNCLTHFDRVVTVPPFSKKNWGYEIVKNDALGRFRYGVPPKGTGDFAYLQHSIATLNEHGKLVTVAPAGMMFRGGAEGSIRKGIVRSDLIEAVIALPPGIFAHTSIPTYIIVINMEKSADRENSVLFIAADKKFHNDKHTASLEEEDVAKIISSYRDYKNIEKYCRVVNVSEIAENDFNLSMSLYVDTSPEIETVDIDNAIEQIYRIQVQRENIKEELFESLNKLREIE